LEIKMILDIAKFQPRVEFGFAELLSPVAVGASFEGLADFLISVVNRDRIRKTE
jgi:hypothetical protein